MSQVIHPLRMISNPRYQRFIKAENEINSLRKKILELEQELDKRSSKQKTEEPTVAKDDNKGRKEVDGAADLSGEGLNPAQVSSAYRQEKDLPGQPIEYSVSVTDGDGEVQEENVYVVTTN